MESRRLKATTAARPSPICTLARRAAIGLACISMQASAALAQSSGRFDLTGPKVEVRVTRAGVTLPIASVPNLQVGDRLWLHPDLPPTQSVRYLMVLVFLRGTTNPPPDNWFIRIETWDKKVREEGVEVTVPDEAQQAVVFLAPVTGGDFTTLRSAVRGRPGIFVRASQDLAAAGFEQARIEKYVASMRELTPVEAADPKQLQDHSNLIATTLALQPNAACIKLPPDQQYTCFTQTGSQSLLDDGHGQTIVDALTGNAGAGLISTAAGTQLAGGGLYSAYVGSIVDLVHIMGSLHTAQYQYIPAIAFPQQEELNLRLNTPPSFHNPKSVIVIGLPSVQPTIPPPLRASNPKAVSCLRKPDVALPVEGAPLVFSTSFAHDLVLHLNYPAGTKAPSGQAQDIPLTPDPFRGGLVLASTPRRHPLPTVPDDDPAPISTHTQTSTPTPSDQPTGTELTGTVTGYWGFDKFTGPTMPLQETPGKDWQVAAMEPAQGWLIAGKDRHLFLTSTGTACVESIALEAPSGPEEKEAWKPADKPTDKPNEVDVTLDVPARDAGSLHLAIHQFGDPNPATLSLTAYNEPAKLEAVHFHAGDKVATLNGTGLAQVREVDLAGLTFTPLPNLTSLIAGAGGQPNSFTLTDPKAPSPPAGEKLTAHVTLQDGRKLSVPVTVEPPRPSVTLIARADLLPSALPKGDLAIKLATEDDLPVADALMFSLKSAQPFPRGGSVEIASPDGSLHTTLSVSDSDSSTPALILEDPETLLGTLHPLKSFGPSAFGPIRLRAVAPDGTDGDWLPLTTLVRLPTLTGLTCPVVKPTATAPPPGPDPAAPAETPVVPGLSAPTLPPAPCTLTGSGLYFIDSIATNAGFTDAVHVPQGFVGTTLAVPPPTGAVYYLHLRDDPATTDTVTLPAGPL